MKTMTIQEFQSIIQDSILAVQQGKTITFPPNGEMIQIIPERVSSKISEEELAEYTSEQQAIIGRGWSGEMARIFTRTRPYLGHEPDPFPREHSPIIVSNPFEDENT
jgi:hypothetical protein